MDDISVKILLRRSFAVLTVLSMVVFASGCGSDDDVENCTAPAGSTLSLTPDSQPITVGGGVLAFDVIQDWTVTVRYSNGQPMPRACFTVSGNFAIPNGYAAYQFLYYPSWTVPNLAVDSGFQAQADDFGKYTFSTQMSAGTTTFYDTIEVRSGTASDTAKIELKQ